MTPQRAFVRKVLYVVAIGLLLIPLFLLARPTSSDRTGGKLAQLREEQGLSQAQLGEIDPASETIKLATLGMRGVAANILWEKANRYKMKKDWTNLAATLNQITRLEPNFLSVWRFQAWNLSYNVSAEFDDYRERYRWVINGIEFLIRGVGYNEREPRLFWDVGWFTAQKIGRADESKEFRKMFREDDEFHKKHKTRSAEERDNWLAGKRWFVRAEDLVKQGEDLRGMSVVIFYSNRPMCQMNYARSLEEMGIFGDKAEQHWNKAGREWTEYGLIPIETTFEDDQGNYIVIALNHQEFYLGESDACEVELDALQPGLREEILWERWNQFSDKEKGALHFLLLVRNIAEKDEIPRKLMVQLDQRHPKWREELLPKRRAAITEEEEEVLQTVARRRTPLQRKAANQAERKLRETATRARDKLTVTHQDVARRFTGSKRSKALKLAEAAKKAERMAEIISGYRNIVNFEYWRRRAEVEKTAEARAARNLVYDAQQALKRGALPEASEAYHKGAAKWRQLLDKEEFAHLADDSQTAEDLMDIVKGYIKLLQQRDELFPEDFALADFIRQRVESQPEGRARAAREIVAAGNEALAQGDLDTAREEYEHALTEWYEVLKAFPALVRMADRPLGEELLDAINGYAKVLEKLDERFLDDFRLVDFLHLQVEHADETLAARRFIAEGNRYRGKSQFPAAQEAYDKGLAEWRKVLDKFPSLLRDADKAITNELTRVVAVYGEILDLRGKPFPEDFILKDFVLLHQPTP